MVMTTKPKIHKHASTDFSLRQQIVIGAVTTLIVQSGEQIAARVVRQPLLVFGLGMLTGCLVYKNRKLLINASTSAIDSSKKVVLAQKENILDLIAEVREEP
jgi:hypothetical protein